MPVNVRIAAMKFERIQKIASPLSCMIMGWLVPATLLCDVMGIFSFLATLCFSSTGPKWWNISRLDTFIYYCHHFRHAYICAFSACTMVKAKAHVVDWFNAESVGMLTIPWTLQFVAFFHYLQKSTFCPLNWLPKFNPGASDQWDPNASNFNILWDMVYCPSS